MRLIVSCCLLLLLIGSLAGAKAGSSSSDPAIFAPGVISTGDDESHPTLSPDGRTLYFLKNTPTFSHWTIVVSRWQNGRWATPEVAPFSGQYGDADVSFSMDGRTMYFVSLRPLRAGAQPKTESDFWKMTASSGTNGGGWSAPVHIPEISSDLFDYYPIMTNSGTLYFGSERRPGNKGQEGTSDLWRARLVNGTFTAPESLGDTFNTPGNDIEAYVPPDERYIIFASNGRPDTRGSYDLYISTRCGATWTTPKNLGDRINSVGWDFSPRMSPDGRWFFFTSNRGFADKPLAAPLTYAQLTERLRAPGNGLRDIYRVDADTVLNAAPACP